MPCQLCSTPTSYAAPLCESCLHLHVQISVMPVYQLMKINSMVKAEIKGYQYQKNQYNQEKFDDLLPQIKTLSQSLDEACRLLTKSLWNCQSDVGLTYHIKKFLKENGKSLCQD